MGIAQFFRILWARRALIVIAVLACLVAAVAVIKLVPPRYTANSRLMLEIVKPDPVTGEVLSSQYARAYVTTQIELIKDYRVAGRVVDSFNWTASPKLAEVYRESAAARDVDFRRWLAQRVIDRTNVQLISGSNILEISYTDDQPDTAAKVADAIREAYDQETRLFRQQTALRNAGWFSNQTEKLRAELKIAEEKKTAFERENGVVLQDDNEDSESARLKALAGVQPMPSIAAPAVAAAPISSPSQAQLAQIDAAINTASQTLGANHPQMVALRQQRQAVAQAAAQEMAAARAASRVSSVSSGPSVGAMFSAQQAKVLAQRGKVNEARQLALDVNVLREQLQSTASRQVELEQEAQSTETGLSSLGSAVAPQSPSFPKIPLLLAGSIALGLGIGVLVSLLVELLNRKVRTYEDLQFDGVPLLGIVTLGEPERKKSLWARLWPFGNRNDGILA